MEENILFEVTIHPVTVGLYPLSIVWILFVGLCAFLPLEFFLSFLYYDGDIGSHSIIVSIIYTIV